MTRARNVRRIDRRSTTRRLGWWWAVAVAAGALGAIVPLASALPADDPADATGPTRPDGGDALECIRRAAVDIGASPAEVPLGGTTTVTWSVAFPSDCSDVEGTIRLGGRPVGPSGSVTEPLLSNGTYVLSIDLRGGGSEILGRAPITVQLPPTVDIRGGTAQWRALMVQALATPDTTVRLAPSVDMDLTGYETIPIAAGVTFTGDPNAPAAPPKGGRPGAGAVAPRPGGATTDPGRAPAPRRSARTLGPRVYTTSVPRRLFEIVGDGVRVSGFRIHGPHFEMQEGDENLENAILVNGEVGVEIADMEIAGWSGQAIRVADNVQPPRQFNPDAVWIHHNFLHHNQHKGGNGYGVVTSAGAYAKIEHNLFDHNRHAIASNGRPGTGYRAASNLVLRGGGVHGTLFNSRTHQFDVHGDQNCPDTPLTKHIWNCGNAGDQFWFVDNTFQYTADNALKIRGAPRVAAYIDGNVFAHRKLGDAVNLQSRTRVTVGRLRPNATGVDSYGRYGVCDVDGDGRDDLFLPTGRTWWYSSGGRRQWSHLRDATERLDRLGLGDFDGDRRCDALTASGGRWRIASGLTGEWRPLPGGSPVPFDQIRFADFDGDRITDVFRRAPSGQWSVLSPGRGGWRDLQSSGFPLTRLRLGDFDGDGRTDVLGPSGGHWSVSWGGSSAWQPLNRRMSKIDGTMHVADVDGNGRDDIVRWKAATLHTGTLSVASAGRGQWRTLAKVRWPKAGLNRPAPTAVPHLGRFDAARGQEVLLVDEQRAGRLYGRQATGARHNLFDY